MKILFALLLSLGIVFLMGGCETTSSTAKSKAKQEEQIILRKGMSGDEIKQLLGEPLRVRKNDESGGSFETWVYEDSREYVIQVEADTREVPYTHPISRETTTITEAVRKLKRDRITLITELFISHGRLAGWKETTKKSIHFQD